MAAFTITVVSGTSPDWSLTVDTSEGVQVGDHVLGAIEDSVDGGVWRAAGTPDGTHIEVVDDLRDPVYGKPKTGKATSWTPTTRFGLSQVPDGSRKWAEPLRRDTRIVDAAIGLVVGRSGVCLDLGEDPIAEITQAHMNAAERFLVSATAAPVVADYGRSPSVTPPEGYHDLSAHSLWYLRIRTESGEEEGAFNIAGLTDPSAVYPAQLPYWLAGGPVPVWPNGVSFEQGSTGPGNSYVDARSPVQASSSYVQVLAATGGPDLGAALGYGILQHDGRDATGVTLNLPTPSDPTTAKGWLAVISSKAMSPYDVFVSGASHTPSPIGPGHTKAFVWDGAAWCQLVV